MDVIIGGIDTTTATSIWAVLYILYHPEVAKKMQEELDSQIGGDRMVTMDDKPQLVYINAVINVISNN